MRDADSSPLSSTPALSNDHFEVVRHALCADATAEERDKAISALYALAGRSFEDSAAPTDRVQEIEARPVTFTVESTTGVLLTTEKYNQLLVVASRERDTAWTAHTAEMALAYIGAIPRDHEDWPLALEYAQIVLPRWIYEGIANASWWSEGLRADLENVKRCDEEMRTRGWYAKHADEMESKDTRARIARYATTHLAEVEAERDDLLARVRSLQAENARYRAALDSIAHPIPALQAEAMKTGKIVKGALAVALQNDPGYLRLLAERALAAHPPEAPANGK